MASSSDSALASSKLDHEVVKELVTKSIEYVNLKKLDYIFKNYLEAAEKMDLSVKKCSSLNIKYLMVYHHQSEPFLSTTYNHFYQNCFSLNIKLSNDGFIYHDLVYKKENLKRHRCNDWAQVNFADKYIENGLATIRSFCTGILGEDCKFIFYFNREQRRVDLKAFKKKGSRFWSSVENYGYGGISITFEEGSPYVDYTCEQEELED